MDIFGVNIPTKVIIGRGSLKELERVAPKYGNKAILLTTGNDLEKVGTLGRALDYLKNAGVEVVIFNDIEPNPKTYNINDAVKFMLDNECDMAIGIGGGSSMDAAKAVALVAKNGGVIDDYMLTGSRAHEDITETYPIICVTTTSGTGSEVTMHAVITDPITKEKPGFGYLCMYPDVSIVDSELTLTLPIGVTAATGIDVFFHAMEAYLSTDATPFTDLCCLEAMRLVKDNLYKAYRDGSNIEARSNMAWANTLAGLAITSSSTVAIHAMGHSVSGITDVSHGWGLCTIAKAYLDFSYDADIKRYATVSRILGVPDSLSDGEAASMCGEYFDNYMRLFNLPTSLSYVGLGYMDINKIAEDTFSAMEYPLVRSLKEITIQDVKKMLEDSL